MRGREPTLGPQGSLSKAPVCHTDTNLTDPDDGNGSCGGGDSCPQDGTPTDRHTVAASRSAELDLVTPLGRMLCQTPPSFGCMLGNFPPIDQGLCFHLE